MTPALKALASQLPFQMVGWGWELLISVATAPAQVPDTQEGFVKVEHWRSSTYAGGLQGLQTRGAAMLDSQASGGLYLGASLPVEIGQALTFQARCSEMRFFF